MSLGQKTLSGFIWTLSSNLGSKVITLILGIILARLLDPEDFGLVAMLYIFFEVSNVIVNSGFSQALIREDTFTEEDKSTAFSINLILAVSLYLILWFGAPWIARFYENSQLVDLTRVMGLTIIIQGLTVVQRADLVHHLRFKLVSLISIISGLIAGIVSVILAFQGFGVWSLAANYVLVTLGFSIIIYAKNPWFPKYFIIRESFQRLFGFGSKLFLSGLLDTFYRNVYKLIIGKFFSASVLGFYTQAQIYVQQLTQGTISTLQSVTYPILSKTKNDPERLKLAYRKIILASSYILFPLTIGLGLVAEPLILTLVGEKWRQSVPFLQLLCLSGALYHLHSINLNILKVMGRSDLFLKLEVIKKVNITIAIVIGLSFGIWGLLIAQVISSYVALLINMYYTRKFIDYSYLEQFKDLLPVLIQSLPMFCGVFLFLHYTALPSFISLGGAVLLGAILYLGTTISVRSFALKQIVDLLSDKYPQIKRLGL